MLREETLKLQRLSGGTGTFTNRGKLLHYVKENGLALCGIFAAPGSRGWEDAPVTTKLCMRCESRYALRQAKTEKINARLRANEESR